MFAYLTIKSGARQGARLLLDEKRENRIGRGLDCQIVLSDPLSSRVHAVIVRKEDGWWVRDAESRNGTYLNRQKIDEARLVEGSTVTIGSSEFEFHETEDQEAHEPAGGLNLTQTLLRDAPVDPRDTGQFGVAALRDPERARDLLMLYQLSIKLLGQHDPDEVVRISLDLLQSRTEASVAGFLWVSDDGQLKPKLVIPEDASSKVRLSESLTRLVRNEGRAVWIADQSAASSTESLCQFADALCVPLIREDAAMGAIHLYRERGRFRQGDFQVAVSLANILAAALVRARRQATLEARHRRLIDQFADFDEMLGESKPMRDLKDRIARVARATGCVLIRGESGVGKELAARAIHKASPRSDRPLLPVNCAAIARDLIESQLFGHKKGAFTGADSDHVGWFQQADLGTLFLDEVGEMTLEGQAKLLRILEGHPFLPVGATKEVSVDVRVIAATNRDLREFVREGRFREDLYYRLTVFELFIPPLRDRGDDIPLLVDFFLEHFKKQHGRPELRLSDAAREKLLSYRWPGNVRQLRNVLDSAVVMADGERIQAADLGLHDPGGGRLPSLRFDYWERKLIQEALARTRGSVPDAAKLLGIGRATLYRKIDEYGVPR